jgi:hypothetical protein
MNLNLLVNKVVFDISIILMGCALIKTTLADQKTYLKCQFTNKISSNYTVINMDKSGQLKGVEEKNLITVNGLNDDKEIFSINHMFVLNKPSDNSINSSSWFTNLFNNKYHYHTSKLGIFHLAQIYELISACRMGCSNDNECNLNANNLYALYGNRNSIPNILYSYDDPGSLGFNSKIKVKINNKEYYLLSTVGELVDSTIVN